MASAFGWQAAATRMAKAWRAWDPEAIEREAKRVEDELHRVRLRDQRKRDRRIAEKKKLCRVASRWRATAIQERGRPPIEERRRSSVGTCIGCRRPSEHLAGGYCPTCRQRGAAEGWCDCGGALYFDGYCRSKGSHESFMRKRRAAKKAAASGGS